MISKAVFNYMERFSLAAALAAVCLIINQFCPERAMADAASVSPGFNSTAQPETTSARQIENAGIGFSYELPHDWDEISPLLMELYNVTADKLAAGEGSPYLVAAYSTSGSRFIPPVLLILLIEQPITSEMIIPLNKMFIAEAKDEQGKTAIARRLNLASEIRFIKEDNLYPGAPLVTLEADTSFGFTVRIMASPFYTANGMLVVSYFAPLDDYEQHETEAMEFLRSIDITESLPYIGCPLSPACKKITAASTPEKR